MQVSGQINAPVALARGNILAYVLIGGYVNSDPVSTPLIRNEVIAYA